MQSFTTNYQKRWQKANQMKPFISQSLTLGNSDLMAKIHAKEKSPFSTLFTAIISYFALFFFIYFIFFFWSLSHLKITLFLPFPTILLSDLPLLDKFYTLFSLNFLDFFNDNPHFWSSFSLDLHLQKGKEKVKIHGWWCCNEQAYEKTVTCDVSDSVRSSRTEAGVPFDRDWHCISLFRSHPIIPKSSWSWRDLWLIGWDNISSSSCASKNCIRATGWR